MKPKTHAPTRWTSGASEDQFHRNSSTLRPFRSVSGQTVFLCFAIISSMRCPFWEGLVSLFTSLHQGGARVRKSVRQPQNPSLCRGGVEYTVTEDSGTVHTSSRLILATGVSDDLSTIPGLQERWGISMFHCFYCHGYEVAGRRLGALATSDRALETAMLLPDWSEDVTLFTNAVLT